MMEQNPFPEERKKREEGDKHRNPSRNQEEPANHDGENPFPEERKKREERRQAPEPKKREEGRQASEPQPEPRGTSKSCWIRIPFLRKERREKKGDKHRNQRREKGDKHQNPSRNQEEPANHDETEPLS